MSSGVQGADDLFDLLESNKLGEVEEIKKVFHDHFLGTKDNWLVNGLFDYYLSTNSLRTVEVLAGVREPHDKHLLDRLVEILSKPGSCTHRVKALTLMGHVARRQPTWLYKLGSHPLFRELLKLLKVEADTLSLMSALLLLVMLLPMLPAALGPYLQEIFEVFGRLASYYHNQSMMLSSSVHLSSTSTTVDKDRLYLLHLQVGLYSLFHRLYAMYPCNFISYLKQQYVQREQSTTFTHTIRPMLDSVRMHPFLVTASKDTEVSANRWKKMEHHDIMAECGRFTLDRYREEVFTNINPRSTPSLDHLSVCTPICTSNRGTMDTSNGDEKMFWSPSMTVPPHSPSYPSSHEPRSTPSTPNNNRTGTSPPEAAVEATPETTPVKDLRKLSTRQIPVGSSAVRALSSLGNGTSSTTSRPSTPTALLNSLSSAVSTAGGTDGTHGLLSHKINKLMSDRHNTLQFPQKSTANSEEGGKLLDIDWNQNGKNDSWQEDQEILEIVNSQNSVKTDILKDIEQRSDLCDEEKVHVAIADLSQKVSSKLRFYSQCQKPVQSSNINSSNKIRRSKSCSDIYVQKQMNANVADEAKLMEMKKLEFGTQTSDIFSYEHLLMEILDQRHQEKEKAHQQSSDQRLSPTTMLDRYIETCTRARANATKQKKKKKGAEDDGEDESVDEDGLDGTNQLLQLMQMQLQFERQRREVHAERNRRLLGKLRDSRALEERNYALIERLKLFEKEVDGLKAELDRSKKESRQMEGQYKEALHHWQSKCVEEEQQNQTLRDKVESLELELKSERKKVTEGEQQLRETEAALFEAGNRLKGALKAANRGKELERTLDTVQKKFLLLGEAQSKLQESSGRHSPVLKQEAAQIQKSYAEELYNLRRQIETRSSLVEALRMRLAELESKDAKKEGQLVELQRLLQETKDRHEFELRAVESKYKAQVEINLLLEGRILELHGTLEATSSTSTATANLASSASPKERSPPLSASLASSSEGSLAFVHSATGIIMNDCCDTAGEIPNLQAIVEPLPSPRSASPSRQQRRVSKQD